jgi:hypothetical protein
MLLRILPRGRFFRRDRVHEVGADGLYEGGVVPSTGPEVPDYPLRSDHETVRPGLADSVIGGRPRPVLRQVSTDRVELKRLPLKAPDGGATLVGDRDDDETLGSMGLLQTVQLGKFI